MAKFQRFFFILRSQTCLCQTTWWPPRWVCCPLNFSTPIWARRFAPWRTSLLSRVSVATLCSPCRRVAADNTLSVEILFPHVTPDFTVCFFTSVPCRLSSALAWCFTLCTVPKSSSMQPSLPARWNWSPRTWTVPLPITAASPTAARGRLQGAASMWCDHRSTHRAVSLCVTIEAAEHAANV